LAGQLLLKVRDIGELTIGLGIQAEETSILLTRFYLEIPETPNRLVSDVKTG
jgi:hypothetical protein